jgi:hypothetical protein
MVFSTVAPSWTPGTMIWTNLNVHYNRKLSCKYKIFWLSGSWEEESLMAPSHFCDYLPFEEDLALYLNNLEFSLSKDDLHQVWLKLACFWRFFLIQCIFTLLLLSPLGLGCSRSFVQFRIPSPKKYLCQVSLKLAQWFGRRSRKCKSLQTDRQTDGQRTTGDQKSSLELRWAKNHWKGCRVITNTLGMIIITK